MKTITKNCIICDSIFHPLATEVKRGRGKVCSRDCRSKHQSNVMRGRIKSKATREKLSKSLTGRKRTKEHSLNISKGLKSKFSLENNPNWRGGKYKSQERVYIRIPNHPNKHSNGYILNSHYVAEKILNRYLTSKEQIHHINFKTDDDCPENLYLFASAASHSEYHGLLKSNKTTLITESNLSNCKEL